MAERFEKVLKEELDCLTREQFSAVMHGEGKALCIAGPGSGKTRVISLRAARLAASADCVKEDGAGTVLTLSFNRPAKDEMRTRSVGYLARLGFCSGQIERMAGFFTVHAYCYRLLREYLRMRHETLPRVISPEETGKIIESVYSSLTSGGSVPDYAMKRLKLFTVTEDETPDFDFGGLGSGLALRVAEEYKARKKSGGLIDFGDMLTLSLKYLENDQSFLERVRNAYAFTQVDEAQDLSSLQYRIVKLIAGENAFYVADDDQSIYGFRGANPATVRLIGNDPGTKKYVLDKNFRSGRDIVDVSSSFILANDDRFRKRLSAASGSFGSVTVRQFPTIGRQSEFAAKTLLKRARSGLSACVLYRNNVSGAGVITELFFAENKRKIDILPKVSGECFAFAGSDFVTRLEQILAKEERACFERPGLLRAAPLPYEIYARPEIRRLTETAVRECFSGRRPFSREAAAAAVETIVKHSSEAADIGLFAKQIDAFCVAEGESLINLSTVHSAKGLEYDTVIIIDCVEGEFPFGDTGSEDHLKEERRLMYVAMTRAKRELIITYPLRCGKLELEASRFIGMTE